MGKKKGKKISGTEKTELKMAKKSSKQIAKEASEKGEEDIETLLEKSSKLNNVEKVVDVKCQPPSPRCNMTLNAHPEKDLLYMFGGEFCNGKETRVYNDLYVYHIRSDTWTQLMVPNPPPPRCSHQAVTMPQLGGQLWLFGGEFSSLSQSQFHHYHELWCLHLSDYSWQKISLVGGPSARSGHRMVACKKLLVLFGGFYDNSREFKYFNDVHIFDVETFCWLKLNISGIPPSPRSGCVLVTTQDQRNVVMYGGYSKERIKKDVDKGIIYTDMYMLSMEKCGGGVDDVTRWRWMNVKQSGDKPSPRCSMSIVVVSSNKAVLFGGVNDEEDNEESMKSNFYNDMYRLEVDKGRWLKVDFNRPCEMPQKKRRRKTKDRNVASNMACNDDVIASSDDDEADDDADDEATDDAVDKSIKKLKVREEGSEKREDACQLTEADSIFKVTIGAPDKRNIHNEIAAASNPTVFTPSPRMRPMLAAKRGLLYMYGGVYEDEKDRVVTLADFYSTDVQRLDGWNVIIPQQQPTEWLESSSDDGTSDDENDDDDDDSSDAESSDQLLDGPDSNVGEDYETYWGRTEAVWLVKARDVAARERIEATDKLVRKAAMRMAKEYWQTIGQ